jgi:two-component system LytT family response regulator
MAINCLIIDDEPIARDILRNYCGHLPYLNILGECGNALEAKNLLLKQPDQLLFLDIHMPVLDGLAFLTTLKNPPQVIFTTAYAAYAVNAFELSAADYLVKPFSLERFIIAVDKVMERLNKRPNHVTTETNTGAFVFIKADNKIYQLQQQEWLYAEAQGNYTKIVTAGGTLLPYLSFSAFEALLPQGFGLRVHRSFMVNKAKITRIEGNRLWIGSQEISIGSNYRSAFLKMIGYA